MSALEAAVPVSNHDLTLKKLSKTAEFNRLTHRGQNPHTPWEGCYRVRLIESSQWVTCVTPPATGAAEWLFIDAAGVPLFYWNRNKNKVLLIS